MTLILPSTKFSIFIHLSSHDIVINRKASHLLPILGVYREVYTSISGETVEELYRHSKFPESPDFVEVLMEFDATLNDSDSYGQRLSAFYQVRNSSLCEIANVTSNSLSLSA